VVGDIGFFLSPATSVFLHWDQVLIPPGASLLVNAHEFFDTSVITCFCIIGKIACRQLSAQAMAVKAIAAQPFFGTGVAAVTVLLIFVLLAFHNLITFGLYKANKIPKKKQLPERSCFL
jgi:hypothetical protein